MKNKGLIFVVGLGPGVGDLLTPMSRRALEASQEWVGYRGYLSQAGVLVNPAGKNLHPYPMGRELERCAKAVELARKGRTVALISSGDPGIYGMAGPLLSMSKEVEVEIVPGLPALSAVAARLGAPLMSDFALISLSDLLVPWNGILYRLEKTASADLVLVLYNPGSSKRRRHLSKALRVVAHWRPLNTPLGIVSRAFSSEERVTITTLREMLDAEFTDMSATVVVGNSRTSVVNGRMVTERGYTDKDLSKFGDSGWAPYVELGGPGLSGREIEETSLGFIRNGLKAYSFDPLEREVVARAIHAVADFSIAPLFRFSPGAVERGVELLRGGSRVWMDTRMGAAGVSKRVAYGLGCTIDVPVASGDPPSNYTRSAWAFRELGERLRGSIVVVGNAPTVLEEVCRLSEEGIIPGLVIGVPVGFVGTVRAKELLLKSRLHHITLLGNRGGTPVAVAIVNALLRLARKN